MRFIIGIIGFPLGIIIIIYREHIKRFIGSASWAESWFGPGGTYTALIFFGLLVSVGSLLWMFGTVQSLFKAFLGPLF